MISKRIFDIVFSFLGLIILFPIIVIIMILIKVRTPGNIFFRQKRFGQFGKSFSMVKFRTMDMNSQGTNVTVSGDKRITRLGRMLRKYKLDELPELWNVLKGDMSFVGPRPDMPEYAEKMVGEERITLELRPGITGPSTLKYRNEEELLTSVPEPLVYNDEVIWPDKVRLNLEYYYRRSFLGDIKIILKTIFNF